MQLKKYLKLPIPSISAATVVYALVVSLVKWRFQFHLNILLFLGGSVIGLFLLDTVETFFAQSKSVFRTLFFEMLFIGASVFIITSSGSLVGSGVVLALFLRILFEQLSEYHASGSLGSWITSSNSVTTVHREQALLIGGVALFVILTLLFLFVG